jgi:hypothetical protein
MEIREEAEEAGLVPKSQQVYWAVEMWLRALKGKEQPLSGHEHFAPGSTRGEFARAIMSGGERFGVSPAAVLRELAEDCAGKETGNRGQETGAGAEETGDRAQETGAEVCSSSSSSSQPDSTLHGQVINLPYGEMHNCITDDTSATPVAAGPYGQPPRPARKFLGDEICDRRHGPEPVENENLERLKARKRRERAIKICPVAGP